MFEIAGKRSNILYHILFWFLYYLLFGFIWAEGGNYRDGYYLEFILLPVRIGAVYLTLYILIPYFLLEKKFKTFICFYLLLLLTGGIIQRFFIYFFYTGHEVFDFLALLAPTAILRAVILINTTVFFVSSVYILTLYFKEKDKHQKNETGTIEIKSDKRFYRIHPFEITHIEGLGNYVIYHLLDNKQIICYTSLKKCIKELPGSFVRIHRSFIINREQVKSYNHENVEMVNGIFLPLSSAYTSTIRQ